MDTNMRTHFAYMEMIYIDNDGNARKTNVGAAMKSSRETRAAFKALRPLEVKEGESRFLCDLHAANGDLVDTILLSKSGFTQVTGQPVLSDEEYRKIDRDYWAPSFAKWRKRA